MSLEHDGEIQPAGTQYLGLIDALIDLFKQRDISDVEVMFISNKLDEKGKTVDEGDQWVAEIRPVAISGLSPEIQEALRAQCEQAPLLGLMVFWLRPAAGPDGKIGVLRFSPVTPGEPLPSRSLKDYESFEKEALSLYLRRKVSAR